MWKTLHGALPVGEQLLARQIQVDGKCKLCGLSESIDHLFLHCKFAKEVWKSAPVWPSSDYSGTVDLRSEWHSLCTRKKLPPTGLSSGALAPWILWQLWKARNSLIFKDKGFSATEVISMAIAAAREWNDNQHKTPVLSRSQPIRTIPQERCVLVRSDAAWSEANNIAGLGWIVKSQSSRRFVGSPLVAEGLALREAVTKCKELGLTRVRFESDCDQLIKALTSDYPMAALYGIVSDIKSVALSFECISFS